MNHFRSISLVLAISVAGTLIACSTAPAMPVAPTALSGTMPGNMAPMDAQMKTMRAMHEKMMSAKTPEDRSKLMAEHMKAMQDGMAMMGAMGTSMGDMKGKGMSADMAAHHPMMEKRMEMMHSMMQMMMDRMPANPPR